MSLEGKVRALSKLLRDNLGMVMQDEQSAVLAAGGLTLDFPLVPRSLLGALPMATYVYETIPRGAGETLPTTPSTCLKEVAKSQPCTCISRLKPSPCPQPHNSRMRTRGRSAPR